MSNRISNSKTKHFIYFVRIIVMCMIVSNTLSCATAQGRNDIEQSNSLPVIPPPLVVDNEVTFFGGKTLRMEKNSVYHTYTAQERFVYITNELWPNVRVYVIYFYDFSGNEISHTEKFEGEFKFMYFDKKARLLAGQRARLVLANTSYLYDLEGNLICEFPHDRYTLKIGVTDDEEYFWYVTSFVKSPERRGPVSLYNHVLIFDTVTGERMKEYSVDGTDLDMVINGKSYFIKLPEPFIE